jgi:o-succinylbenzoate synthase
MSEPIYIYRYTLHSRRGLNSRSDRTAHEGLLIRINGGVGCIQPWEVLGDPSLDEVLDDLKSRRLFRPLVRAAVKCAMVDGAARRAGVSLFDGVKVPRSHATIVGGRDKIDEALAAGFDVVKMKAGRDVQAELQLIHEVHADHPELRWRLDFNNVLGGGELRDFVKSMGESLRSKIDFLEDPCRTDDPVWQGIREVYGVPLAIDRDVPIASNQFRYAVIKPALDDVTAVCAKAMLEGWHMVLTSYMDHPIGQCYAAWCAGKVEKRFYGLLDPVAGLMTHGLFEPNVFIDRMGPPQPEWRSPAGTGLGFDDLIEELNWEEL